MYLTPTNKHWLVDVETDGLRDEATQIFVVCVENAITDEAYDFTDKEEFLKWIQEDKDRYYVGHNSIAFDIPILNRFWDARIGSLRIVDTFVLSMLYSPSLSGGHSLEAWGNRVKLPKLAHKDFTQYSEEMLTYCRNDVKITKKVFTLLSQRMREVGFTEKGPELEHLSWHILQNKQRRHGFPFDYKRAHELYVKLRERERELREQIYKLWPPQLQVVGEFKRAYKGDGTHTALFERHTQQYPKLEISEDGGYKAYDWVEFNLGSPKQRIEKLLAAGWTPTSLTPKGNPKVDEESLTKYSEESGNKEALALAKWIVTNSRANMIRTWMDAYKEKTGAIHGSLWLAGTLRYRHNDPNSANIPAVRLRKSDDSILYGEEGAWTYEARDLWTCGDPDKYSLVGIDAKGIQLRVLSHYLQNDEFTEQVLEGDIHEYNRRIGEIPTRAMAKTFIYAFVLGCGDAKAGAIIGGNTKDGKALKQRFTKRVVGLERLLTTKQQELRRHGRLILCDRTPVLVPEPRIILAYLLQGDESRLMKQAAIFVDQEIRRNKFDANKVGDIHDEWQFVVRADQVEDFIAKALPCFGRAGEEFSYSVPIAGDYKVGKTWAETH